MNNYLNMTNIEKLAFITEAHELVMRYRLWDMPGKTPGDIQDLDDASWFEFSESFLPRIPKTLYRYRPFNKFSVDELKNGYAWFSHPQDFDDGTDSALNNDIESEMEEYALDPLKVIIPLTEAILSQKYCELFGSNPDTRMIEEVAQTWLSGKLNIESAKEIVSRYNPEPKSDRFLTMLERFNDNASVKTMYDYVMKMLEDYMGINKSIRSNIYCLCLAEEPSNDVMWSKYAGECTGFCIGYKIDTNSFVGQRTLMSMRPIYYGVKKPLRFFEILIEGLKANADNQINGWSKDTYKDMDIATLTKPTDWAFQREWRIIFNPEAKENKQPFPFVSSIILGDKMPDENKKVLIDIATENGWDVFERSLNKSGSHFVYRKLGEAKCNNG